MTPEEEKLDHRFWYSLHVFELVIKDYKKRDTTGQGNEFIKILESAREAFSDVHEQWRSKVGAPTILNATFLAKFLRDVADDIEREAKPYFA